MFDYRNQRRVARIVPPARPQKEAKFCNTSNDEVEDSEALDMACAAAVLAADPVCELSMPVHLLHKAALTFKHCVLLSAFHACHTFSVFFTDTHIHQVAMAVITTAAFALQLVIFKSKLVGTWGAICEGLALSFAFFAAKEAGARACNRWRIQGHHDYCAPMTALCAFSVIIMYYPFGVSACFCFCLLGMPTEMLWFGERKQPTHVQATAIQTDSDAAIAAQLQQQEEARGAPCKDACVGGPEQRIDELGTAAQEAVVALETGIDALLAAQLQKEEGEAHGRVDTQNAPCQGSLTQETGSRTDGQMKELLKGLQVPHIVRKSKTHGQLNCLIDSILLALQDKQYIKPLAVDERAAICSSIRRHLIDHHGVEPQAPDGRHSYLSHEDSFGAICNQLRGEHPNIWLDDVDVTRLSIVAVVFDRFQRRQLYDESGAWSAELEDVNAPVVSTPLNASGELTEVCIQLYCNTLADDHGTPYHYEWISVEADRSEEEEESGVDDDEDNPALPLPVLPLRAQLSPLSLCAFMSPMHAQVPACEDVQSRMRVLLIANPEFQINFRLSEKSLRRQACKHGQRRTEY